MVAGTTTLEKIEAPSEKLVYSPRTDIYETDDAVVVVADLPGVSKDGLDVTVENNRLRLYGTVDDDSPRTGNFERSFVLSDRVDGQGIDAAFKNGVVKLTLPKVQEAKARKIPVKT